MIELVSDSKDLNSLKSIYVTEIVSTQFLSLSLMIFLFENVVFLWKDRADFERLDSLEFLIISANFLRERRRSNSIFEYNRISVPNMKRYPTMPRI